MVSSWPRDALTVRENLFEARTPTSQFSHARRCNSTPARGRTPGPIAASLRVQKEKLRELEKRLRCPRVEPLEDVYDRGGIARFLEEIAVRIDRVGARLQVLDGLPASRRMHSPTRFDPEGPHPCGWESEVPCLSTYPSWPEKAELAWRKLAASWEEMANAPSEASHVPPNLWWKGSQSAPSAPSEPVAWDGTQESTSLMTPSLAAVGRKAPQPREEVRPPRGERSQRRASLRGDAPSQEGFSEPQAVPKVFQATPRRHFAHLALPGSAGFAGPTEPLAMGMGSSCEWQESPRPQPAQRGARRAKADGLLLGEPEFDPTGHQWAK